VNDLKNKINSEKSDLQRRNEYLEYEFQQLSANLKKLHQDLDNSNLQLENEIIVSVFDTIWLLIVLAKEFDQIRETIRVCTN
jgi:hypothetical protein